MRFESVAVRPGLSAHCPTESLFDERGAAWRPPQRRPCHCLGHRCRAETIEECFARRHGRRSGGAHRPRRLPGSRTPGLVGDHRSRSRHATSVQYLSDFSGRLGPLTVTPGQPNFNRKIRLIRENSGQIGGAGTGNRTPVFSLGSCRAGRPLRRPDQGFPW
jgi:hypothetical protein